MVGRVARAHGNRGQVIINPETDFPEQRFRDGNVLYAHIDGRARSFRIVAARFHAGRPVVLLGGVDTMTQAETLAGVELRVPETDLAALPAGTYYHHQLIGCAVRTAEGEPVGTVDGGPPRRGRASPAGAAGRRRRTTRSTCRWWRRSACGSTRSTGLDRRRVRPTGCWS